MSRTEKFAKASAKQFILITISSFILEFTGKYLVPYLAYHCVNGAIKNKHQIIRLTTLLQPMLMLAMTIAALPTNPLNFALSIAPIITAYLNTPLLPAELFQFFKLISIMFSDNFTEKQAEELGQTLGSLFGTVSAKSLGVVLASKFIGQLPKLKNEEIVKKDTVATRKNESTPGASKNQGSNISELRKRR